VANAGEGARSSSPGPARQARPVLALAAASATAVVGALVVGEYELRGLPAVLAGTVFGLVVGEVTVAVGRRQDLIVGVPAAVMVGSALVWAAWIWSGQPWTGLPAGAWTAAGIGVVVTLVWVAGLKVREPGPPGGHNPPGP
jgi:hypothetical protein